MKKETREMTSFSDVIKKSSKVSNDSRPVFGIDLGTTNSAISVVTDGDKVTPIRLKSGKYTMPSCVMWTGDGFIVGEEAYKNRHLASVVYSVKRYMQKVGKKVTFKKSETKQLTMTPAEVSAEILKGLVEQTGGVFGEVKDVVVTVPAYFDQNGRNATREACELAGLNLVDILNEPTAASLLYDIDVNEDSEDVLIYDFGGGTFDVTLARVVSTKSEKELDDIYGFDSDEGDNDEGKIVKCLGVAGDSFLGGDDVDQEMYRIVCKKLEGIGIDTSKFTREFKEALTLRLEGLKKNDSMCSYETKIQTKTADGKDVDVTVSISPDDFREALQPNYLKCKRIVKELLGRVPNKAKTLILVGGSTKNPHLHAFLKRDFPEFTINDGIGQDLAVTMGAAIKGKIAKFGNDRVQIFDVLPITIGIKTEDTVTPLIDAGTTLPANNSAFFTTTYDGQEVMDIEVMQGNSYNPDACVSLGKLSFKGIPKAPKETPQLGVSIVITATSQMICKGSINGQEQEMVLDLTGETAEQVDRDAKYVKRWRKVAEGMNEKDAATLNALIDGYPSISNKKDIMNFIRTHTEGLSDDRSKNDSK